MNLTDRTAYMLATGGGAGLSPVAPGTIGALEGIAIYLGGAAATRSFQLPDRYFLVELLLADVLVLVIGVWASGLTVRMLRQTDPQRIIIDEVAGQMIALTPLSASPSILGVICGFALFRLLDIFKPYPIRKIEHLRGGFGVMLDDVLAGVFAAALTLGGRLLCLF